jgi:hypothetical protein
MLAITLTHQHRWSQVQTLEEWIAEFRVDGGLATGVRSSIRTAVKAHCCSRYVARKLEELSKDAGNPCCLPVLDMGTVQYRRAKSRAIMVRIAPRDDEGLTVRVTAQAAAWTTDRKFQLERRRAGTTDGVLQKREEATPYERTY